MVGGGQACEKADPGPGSARWSNPLPASVWRGLPDQEEESPGLSSGRLDIDKGSGGISPMEEGDRWGRRRGNPRIWL